MNDYVSRRAELETELSYVGRRRKTMLALISDLRADAANAQVVADQLTDTANSLADLESDLRAAEGRINDALEPYYNRDHAKYMRSQVPGSY